MADETARSKKPDAAGTGADGAPAKPGARRSAPVIVESGRQARRRRSSTGRFRDRTLNWFKAGDEIDPDAEPASDEYAPAPVERPPWLIPVVGGAVALIVLIILLSVF